MPLITVNWVTSSWEDQDRDGIQDAGEPGINGVTVKLYNAAVRFLSEPPLLAASDGAYLFDSLTAGSYQVEFVARQVMRSARKIRAATMPWTATPISTGKTACVTLEASETNRTVDAGLYVHPAQLGDRVWEDKNANGIQDAGEPGIAGATVELYACNSSVLASTTTNSSGLYEVHEPGGGQLLRGLHEAGRL